jgi:hypothetical protein
MSSVTKYNQIGRGAHRKIISLQQDTPTSSAVLDHEAGTNLATRTTEDDAMQYVSGLLHGDFTN